jgi:imidazolonepropionase-like amidohydrolase
VDPNPQEVVTEVCEMVSAGASNMTVIRSLTSQAAELLQLDSLIGSIVRGKVADLTLVAEPVEDITSLVK